MTPEQEALIRKAHASVKGARVLAEEKLFDFAVSRAYYAMFYVAEAFLLGEDVAASKHSSVIALFGQRFAKTGQVPKEFHRYLIEARDSRNAGDYDAAQTFTEQDAEKQISRADKFLDLAERLLDKPTA